MPPVIDISALWLGTAEEKDAIGRSIDAACRDNGFFSVLGHGIEDSLIEDVRAIAVEFFDLPVEEKRLVHTAGSGRGYLPFLSESLGATLDEGAPPDLKESYNVKHGMVDDQWPARPVRFRKLILEYFKAMEALAAQLIRGFAIALKLPEEFFDNVIDQPNAVLRLAHYPQLGGDAHPGALRAGAHTDYGTLTILLPDPEQGGLEVSVRDRWVEVDPLPGAFHINIGDLMMRWTNDRWISTLHRVVNPSSLEASHRRLSIVYLHNPNRDALIECLPSCHSRTKPPQYPPVRADDYLGYKSKKSRRSR